MRSQSIAPVFSFLFLATLVLNGPCQAEAATEFATHISPYLQQHCISCHGPEKQKANLRLDRLSGAYDTDMLAIWTDVYDVLQSAEMPPKEHPQPPVAQNQKVLTWIKTHLSTSRQLGGSGSFRRLNRRELDNTFNQLLGIKADFANMLPPDGMKDNFDNRASALHFSDIMIERYLEMTQRILDNTHVWGDRAAAKEYHYDFAALGSSSDRKAKSKALADKEAVKLLSQKGIRIPSKGPMFGEEFQRAFRSNFANAKVVIPNIPPNKLIAFDISLYAASQPHHRQPILQIYNHKRLIAEFPITGSDQDPQRVQFHVFNQSRDNLRIGIESIYPLEGIKQNSPHRDAPVIHVKSLTITAGYQAHLSLPQSPSGRDNAGNDEARARAWLAAFVPHAVRRPSYDATPWIRRFDTFLQSGMQIGDALKTCMQAVFVHPDFMCLQTPEGLQGTERHEAIANRLSYFLWSTAPDAELLQLTRDGRIDDATTIAQQVKRMLADPRSQQFMQQFSLQWTGMNKLLLHFHDRHRWYGMTRFLGEAMQSETTALFKELIYKNLPAKFMLDSNFAMRNDIMASYYGEQHEDMQASFRSTPLPDNSPKSGLLGQAGIMALTSHGQAPITRGTWMLRTILDDPPPPPPLDVPELNAKDPKLSKKSLREQLHAHQDDPRCALCHHKIDPLGFAFQQFDHMGLYHEKGHTNTKGKKNKSKKNNKNKSNADPQPIDTSGAMPQGETFKDYKGMKQVLLEHYSDDFARSIGKFLLAYGIGRDLHPDDIDTLETVITKLDDKHYPMQDLIINLVQCTSFLDR